MEEEDYWKFRRQYCYWTEDVKPQMVKTLSSN